METQPERTEVQFEDSDHPYTCTVGKGCYTKHYLNQYCIVKHFMDSYEGQKVTIVNALYCYDNQDVQSYIICVNQALYFKYEEVALTSTFQARASGAVVRNTPIHFEKTHHSLSLLQINIYLYPS